MRCISFVATILLKAGSTGSHGLCIYIGTDRTSEKYITQYWRTFRVFGMWAGIRIYTDLICL